MSQEVIPKKIYRHVLKGLQFFHTMDGSGCTLNELVSYVFLKNGRVYKPPVVKKWVEDVLGTFQESAMLRGDPWGRYQLDTVLQQRPHDNDEDFVLNPDHTRHHADNSSQETLSGIPHYQRVLRRKGTPYTLPKHRIHTPPHALPQHEISTLNTATPKESGPETANLLSVSKLNVLLDPLFGRHSSVSLDNLGEISSEEES